MARFAGRTPGEFHPNAVTRALAERRARGLPVHDATLSNPTQAGLFDETGWLGSLADPRAAVYTPEPRGLARAREAVEGYYAGHGIALGAEQVFLTGSTSESYSWLFKLLCDPGDEVLVPRPSYPLLESLAALECVRTSSYSLVRDEGWGVDFAGLEHACTARSRAVVFVHPNNPTGNFLKRAEADRLAEFCARRQMVLISDEVFYDFAFAPGSRRFPPVVSRDDAPVVSLGGFSKLAALPQMKLGWIAVNGPASWKREALERLEWVADSYLPGSAPVQWAAAEWMHGLAPERRARVRERTRANLEGLARGLPPATRLLRPEGGWSAVVELPRLRSEEEWVLALLDRGVLVQPGYFYDFEREAFVVVSLLAPEPVTQALLAEVRALL